MPDQDFVAMKACVQEMRTEELVDVAVVIHDAKTGDFSVATVSLLPSIFLFLSTFNATCNIFTSLLLLIYSYSEFPFALVFI